MYYYRVPTNPDHNDERSYLSKKTELPVSYDNCFNICTIIIHVHYYRDTCLYIASTIQRWT